MVTQTVVGMSRKDGNGRPTANMGEGNQATNTRRLMERPVRPTVHNPFLYSPHPDVPNDRDSLQERLSILIRMLVNEGF
jgi:hypothetical protein